MPHLDRPGRPPGLKERLPSQVLVAVIEHRLRALRCVHRQTALDPLFRIAVDRPRSHPLDADGRSWDVHGLHCGATPAGALLDELRHVVDGVRDAFDLDPAAKT
jgi:hypothetical protein